MSGQQTADEREARRARMNAERAVARVEADRADIRRRVAAAPAGDLGRMQQLTRDPGASGESPGRCVDCAEPLMFTSTDGRCGFCQQGLPPAA